MNMTVHHELTPTLAGLRFGRVAIASLAALLATGGCEGSSLEDRDEEGITGPVTDRTLDREEGEGTELRRAERNIFLPQIKAEVVLEPTEGNETEGQLELGPAEEGVQLVGSVTGLRPAGVHGIHIHETGDCSAPDASSAGEHFNPHGARHGRAYHGEHHVGDMDNIKADNDGEAGVERTIAGATLGDGADTDVAGKAVVIHSGPDDYRSQPDGNAGDRIACGVIEIVSEP
jgi:superoxide dismutase, Cu-Zn family